MSKRNHFQHRRWASQKGFTLLEVIVCLLIFAIAMLGFHQGQSSSVRLAVRSENQSVAIQLAQQQMTEIEIQLRHKNFTQFLEEEKGEFKDEKFKAYKWNRKLEKVDLGCFIADQQEKEDSGGGYFGMAGKIFEQAVRKIKVTVEWEEGQKKRSVHLTQLYVRYNDIPQF